MLYLTSSSFPALFSIMGKTYPKDVWLSWDSGLTSAGATATVGAAVAAASLASDLQSPYISPVYYYQNILNAGSMTAAVLGDDQFEAKGSDHVLALDAEELTALLYGVLGDSYYYDLSRRPHADQASLIGNSVKSGADGYAPSPKFGFYIKGDLHVSPIDPIHLLNDRLKGITPLHFAAVLLSVHTFFKCYSNFIQPFPSPGTEPLFISLPRVLDGGLRGGQTGNGHTEG